MKFLHVCTEEIRKGSETALSRITNCKVVSLRGLGIMGLDVGFFSSFRLKENVVILAVITCLRTLMIMCVHCKLKKMTSKTISMTYLRLFLRPSIIAVVSELASETLSTFSFFKRGWGN